MWASKNITYTHNMETWYRSTKLVKKISGSERLDPTVGMRSLSVLEFRNDANHDNYNQDNIFALKH